jgi:inner membrane protein
VSSFVGHALAPVILYAATEPGPVPRRPLWPLALVATAWAPDVDYLLRSLILPGDPPIRVTHSVLGSLVVPALVVAILAMRGVRGRTLRLRATQAGGAGLSHVLLDLLVGVTPAALLWPFSSATVRLAGGILPSAGRLSLGNPYLYRNLLLEIGVLLPILGMVILLRAGPKSRARRLIAVGGLGAVSICFMLLSAALPR